MTAADLCEPFDALFLRGLVHAKSTPRRPGVRRRCAWTPLGCLRVAPSLALQPVFSCGANWQSQPHADGYGRGARREGRTAARALRGLEGALGGSGRAGQHLPGDNSVPGLGRCTLPAVAGWLLAGPVLLLGPAERVRTSHKPTVVDRSALRPSRPSPRQLSHHARQPEAEPR